MTQKYKAPHRPIGDVIKKRPNDGYIVFDSDLKRLEKKQADKLKIQKAKEI